MERVAIVGLGVISSAGLNKNSFWANVKNGRSFVDPIERFDSALYPSRIAGQIHQLDAYTHLSGRLIKKIDVFSHMALVSSEEALKDAQIDLEKIDKKRVGVFMGNAIGGWLFAETELRDLYLEGREGISPYMASAWFPAAPQGQVTIYYGFKGYSKTVVMDKASSTLALWYAAETIKDKKIDYAVAGGMEAPITPYALLCCNTNGSLSKNNLFPKSAYRPYALYRDGFVVGEGAGMVVLERKTQAEKSKKNIYGYIDGVGFTCDGFHRAVYRMDTVYLEKAISDALDDAGWKKSDVEYICLDGEATSLGDVLETQAIKNVFGKKAYEIPMSAPKAMFGNLLGAQGALDLICVVLSMKHQVLLPTINYAEKDPLCDLDYIPNKARECAINKALIISRGRGGINVVLAVSKE